MPGATVTKMPRKPSPEAVAALVEGLKIITITPEKAMQLLERNNINRPLNDQHVKRIARQITDGKWRFNGDTIKIATTNDVLDGQHRLWAIIEAKTPVDTIIVEGIEREAFATIDTLRKPRSFADIVALNGTSRHRNYIASALTWLIRWQSGVIETYKAPENRVENSDIETAFAQNPGIVRAVEECHKARGIGSTAIIAFLYYVIFNRNEKLAERMIDTLADPAGIGVNDPFFRFRAYLAADHRRPKDALTTIALGIKAANAAYENKKIQTLSWKSQGKSPEAFPTLDIA